MMYEVLGIEKVDYVSKKTSKRVIGTKLYLQYKRDHIEGHGVKEVYCPGDMAAAAVVGDVVKLMYNEYGRLEEVTII